MKKRIKRCLAIMLSILIFAGASPISVFAADEHTHSFVSSKCSCGAVSIDDDIFLDEYFKQMLLDSEMGADGVLSAEEIQNTTVLDFTGYGSVTEFYGIYVFTEVEKIICKSSSLVSVSVSSLKKLKYIDVSNSRIRSLDLSNNPAVTYIDCSSCTYLEKININNCVNLVTLKASDNSKLKTIDTSDCISLENLQLDKTYITDIDLTANTALKYVNLDRAYLDDLDLSNNTLLETFSLVNGTLKSIKLGSNTNLKSLIINKNLLSSLDISGCPNLTEVDCSENRVNALDISNNDKLETLNCSVNNIPELDLSEKTVLKNLNCSDNGISVLNFNACTSLESLDCRWNKMPYVNLGVYNNVKELWDVQLSGQNVDCYIDSQSTTVDVSKIVPDAGKVTVITGGTLNGNTLTVADGAESVIYRYDADHYVFETDDNQNVTLEKKHYLDVELNIRSSATVSGVCQSSGSAADITTITLTSRNYKSEKFTTTVTGNSANYIIAGVPLGKYTLSATKNGNKTVVYDEVEVTSTGLSQNKSLVPLYNITTSIVGGNGTILISPAESEAASGDNVVLTAQAETGYNFKNWVINSGNITINDLTSPCVSFEMPEGDISVEAVFEKNENPSIVVYTVGGGTCSSSAATSAFGTGVYINIDSVDDGWEFSKWRVVSGGVSLYSYTNQSTEFTMLDENVVIEAIFKYNPKYRIYIDESIPVNGEYSKWDTSTRTSIEIGVEETVGSTISLYAKDYNNYLYRFEKWEITSGNTTSKTYASSSLGKVLEFTMPKSDVYIRAVYKPCYHVNISSAIKDGTVSFVDNQTTFAAGETVDFDVIADEGMKYGSCDVFTDNAYISYNSYYKRCSFTMPEGDVLIKPNFVERIPVTLTVITDGNGTVDQTSLIGSEGEDFTLEATPLSGYSFYRWKVISGELNGIESYHYTQNYITPTFSDYDTVLQACFTPTHQATLIAGEGGYVSGEGFYGLEEGTVYGGTKSNIYISADPQQYYTFDYWEVVSGKTSITLDDPSYGSGTFVMPDNDELLLKAHFKLDPEQPVSYKVSVIIGDTGVTETQRWEPDYNVDLYINKPDGYIVKEYQVISGDVEITKGDWDNDTFVMPENDVVIKAILEEDPDYDSSSTYYSVSIIDDGNGEIYEWDRELSVGAGEELYLYTYSYSPDQGKKFFGFEIVSGEATVTHNEETDEWILSDATSDIVLKAMFTDVCEDGHTYGTYTVYKPATHTEDGVKIRFCSAEECGLPEKTVIPADKNAHTFVDGACSVCYAKQITTDNATTSVDGVMVKDSNSNTLAVDETVISSVEADKTLSLDFNNANVLFSKEVVSTFKSKNGELTINVDVDNEMALNFEQTIAVPETTDGTAVVVNVTATIDGEEIHELGGEATVRVPYDVSKINDSANLVIYYVDSNGNIEEITDFTVDSDGFIEFKTDHFSTFVLSLLALKISDIIVGDENTTVDFVNNIIFTKSHLLGDVSEALKKGSSYIVSQIPSYESEDGNVQIHGTGTSVEIVVNGTTYSFMVVVEGDLNGDGVCDVLDASAAALYSQGKDTSNVYQRYAAKGCDAFVDEEITAIDYSYIVNAALM